MLKNVHDMHFLLKTTTETKMKKRKKERMVYFSFEGWTK